MTEPLVYQELTTGPLWWLNARPAAVERLATELQTYIDGLAASVESVGGPGRALLVGAWIGQAADGYAEHMKGLDAAVDDVSIVNDPAVRVLYDVADHLRRAQLQLDDSWATVANVLFRRTDAGVTFSAADEAEAAAVGNAIAAATTVHVQVDETLARAQGVLAGTAQGLRIAEPPGWQGEKQSSSPRVVTGQGVWAVDAGRGGDSVVLSTEPETGRTVVVSDDLRVVVPDGVRIIVRTGSGNDRVTVADAVRQPVVVLGGEGDDVITGGNQADTLVGMAGGDRLVGRGGNDRLRGGADRDQLVGLGGADLLTGSAGNDDLYGGDDEDLVAGGAGRDYVDGGRDDDLVRGDAGRDIVTGGRGDDRLESGSDDDVVYAGHGVDIVDAEAGDTVYGEPTDLVRGAALVPVTPNEAGDLIRIEGSPEFRSETEDMLDTLRSSPAGQQLLEGLEGHDDEPPPRPVGPQGMPPPPPLPVQSSPPAPPVDLLRIVQYDDRSNIAPLPGGDHMLIRFNPAYNPGAGPVVTTLQHEFAHAYDYWDDGLRPGVVDEEPGSDKAETKVPNPERVATGLPIDDDGDPATPNRIAPEQPLPLTQNGLREEMGLAPLKRYS